MSKEQSDQKFKKTDTVPREVREFTIKPWFLNLYYNQNERLIILKANRIFVKEETENSIFVEFESDHGNLEEWLSKFVVTIRN